MPEESIPCTHEKECDIEKDETNDNEQIEIISHRRERLYREDISTSPLEHNDNNTASRIEEEVKNKLEHTSENDPVAINTNVVVPLESCNQCKNRFERKPASDKICNYGKKDKEKCLSKDGSHGSVESCNRLFVIGEEWSPEKELIVSKDKIVKKYQHDDSLVSKFFVRKDSSFMNWISNMMNGLSKSEQNMKHSLPLAFTNSNYGNMNLNPKLIECSYNQDTSRKMGFETIFRSLYQPNSRENTKFGNQYLSWNEKLNFTGREYGEGMSRPHLNLSDLLSATEKNLQCSENLSLGKRKACGKNYQTGYLESMWMSRFASKTSAPILNFNICNHRVSESRNYAPIVESSVYLKRNKRDEDEKFVYILKNSEALEREASVINTYSSNEAHLNSDVACGTSSLRSNAKTPANLYKYVRRKIPEFLAVVFEAIKRLCLSRADVLKWMQSHSSVSPLAGFFLRLRICKGTKGLGGSGYHVACISGTGTYHNEATQNFVGDLIPVSVWGMKCSIESQYISNRIFHEDELLLWWWTTVKRGGQIPSVKALTVKIVARKNMGL